MRIAFNDKTSKLISSAIGISSQSVECLDFISIKAGMTNTSFLFQAEENGKKYILRIPGPGADKLINRSAESEAYSAIKGKGICPDPMLLDATSGIKLSEFLDDIHNCNPCRWDEVEKCMSLLKRFHKLKLSVSTIFDLQKQIDFYRSLFSMSRYEDYDKVRKDVNDIQPFIDRHRRPFQFCHIDSVADNFIFLKDGSVQLIDWEYASMQDPLVDIAAFAIYSNYDKEQSDRLIDVYFDEDSCTNTDRLLVYSYMACLGLLWSNWCEYKACCGIEFGPYANAQFSYAKLYSKLVKTKLMENKHASC